MQNPKDIPNFAAWSNENLAKFCTDSYLRMQEQQEVIEQLRIKLSNISTDVKQLYKTVSNYLEEPL
jgi:hypothetical protein